MSTLNAIKIDTTFKNKIERLEKFLIVYAEMCFSTENKLLPAQRKILLYYLHKGLTDETLKTVCEDTNFDKNHLHGINKKLRDRGYLIRNENNHQKFHLNPELELIRKKVMEDDCRLIIVTC